MKILVISQYYYPEPFKIHEICEELARLGHSVTVLTGRPNYPDGKLYDGYEKNNMEETRNGVHILRTKISTRGTNFLTLIRNYMSYPHQAKKKLKTIKMDFDIIYVYQLTPIFMLKPAIYLKKKYQLPIYIYCLDLWPASLNVIGIKNTNMVYKLFNTYCRKLYAACDYISVSSPSFIEYFKNNHHIDTAKLDVIPQHGEDVFLDVKPYVTLDKIYITYAGNIGKAQDFQSLIRALLQISETLTNKIHFQIIGNGSYLQEFKTLVSKHNLDSYFSFIERKAKVELISYFNKTSLFFLSLNSDTVIGNTIPTKLQTYLSAGRGVIGVIDGDSQKVIQDAKCGYVCSPGDDKSLSKILASLIKQSCDEELEIFSKNSREYFLQNYTIIKHVKSIQNKMEDIINESI